MRINIYSQELTSEINTEVKKSGTGRIYTAVRMMLESSPRLHCGPGDDDRSAVTFWLPRSKERRELLAKAFEKMAKEVRSAAPEETSLPVLPATCGKCKHSVASCGAGFCTHFALIEGSMKVKRDEAPPAWCPLRIARVPRLEAL